MYNQKNTEHNKSTAPLMMSPRISFSNDFVESQSALSTSQAHQIRAAAAYRDAPVSPDFEFSVTNYSMMTADELFFKGRLLPLKESCSSSSKTTTLRDELLQNDNEEEEGFASRPPKNPTATRWRGFLGLRKSHIGSKKSEKPLDKRPQTFHHDDVQMQCTKNSQDFVD